MSIFERKAAKILNKAGIEINGSNPWDVQIKDKSIFRDVILKGSLGLGDGYVKGKWDVESVDQFFERLLLIDADHTFNFLDFAQSVRNKLINTQAGRRAFMVGQKHYDLGNGMYEQMLGESMGYSSGLYLDESDDLATAQYNKFEDLCKKLELKPGMKVLEIGAGWGTFARHAAKNYGVEVVGLTISKEQKKFADKRCEGLPVEILLVDYRNLDEKYNSYFDRVVSIEMVEAVGKKNIDLYFDTVEKAMKEDGLFGMQAILGSGHDDTFLSTQIFPNGHVPSIDTIEKSINRSLHIDRWDSFGRDYEKTLLAWEENFRNNWDNILELKNNANEYEYDDNFFRMWRYYLLCCAGSFRVGFNDVVQVVISKQNAMISI